MSTNSLKKMLSNIEQKEPINLSRFHQLVQSLNLGIHFELSDIDAKKISGNRYRINSLPTDLHQALSNYIKQTGEDRISSSRQNLSHEHKVMGSYLLVICDAHYENMPQQNTYYSSHPIVVIINADGTPSYPPNFNKALVNDTVDISNPQMLNLSKSNLAQKEKDVIIIENRQLFLQWEKTKAFLQKHCQFNSLTYDIIFGAGNDISNSLHHKFLSKYRKLYLCCDVDLGGVTIANNLMKLLPQIPMEFVMPNDIENRLNQVASHINTKTLSEIRNVCKNHPELNLVCHIITKTHKTLEQESYLYD